MLRRLRGHLNPSMVVAILALFVALGGGYALAFSGSGSLQKAGKKGFPDDSTPHDVRTLTGIGAIQVECNSGEMFVYFRNSSSKQLLLKGWQGVASTDAVIGADAAPDNSSVLLAAAGNNAVNTFDVHVSPIDGSKAPQADVHITVDEQPVNCATETMTVLALNTQE